MKQGYRPREPDDADLIVEAPPYDIETDSGQEDDESGDEEGEPEDPPLLAQALPHISAFHHTLDSPEVVDITPTEG
jgi:hypothetical protein